MKLYSLNDFANNKFYKIELEIDGMITLSPTYVYMLNFVTHGPCTALSEKGIICFHLKDIKLLLPVPAFDYKKYWKNEEVIGLIEQEKEAGK